MAVDNLFKKLNQNAGPSPELVFEDIPIIEQMFNTQATTITGDTVRFDNLETPFVDDLDVENYPDACEGSTVRCVTSKPIELHMTRGYNDIYRAETCEIKKLEALSEASATDMLNTWKGRTDRAYTLAKAKVALQKDIIPKLTPTVLPMPITPYSNVWQEMNAALTIMISDNEYISPSNYVAVISRSYYLAHQELKGACCDFLTGVAPDVGYVPSHDMGSIVVVPDSWLKDAAGDYYDLAIYAKAFALYWFRCMESRFFEWKEPYLGETGYFQKGKWGTSYDNHDEAWLGNMGILVKSTFVEDYVAPEVSISATVNATVGAVVDTAYLVANASLTSTGLTNPIYEVFSETGSIVQTIDTTTAGTVTYSVRARSGQKTTEKVEFSLVVA